MAGHHPFDSRRDFSTRRLWPLVRLHRNPTVKPESSAVGLLPATDQQRMGRSAKTAKDAASLLFFAHPLRVPAFIRLSPGSLLRGTTVDKVKLPGAQKKRCSPDAPDVKLI
jgi:hypothetical protein